jgi:hypothetical protein
MVMGSAPPSGLASVSDMVAIDFLVANIEIWTVLSDSTMQNNNANNNNSEGRSLLLAPLEF